MGPKQNPLKRQLVEQISHSAQPLQHGDLDIHFAGSKQRNQRVGARARLIPAFPPWWRPATERVEQNQP